VARRDQIDDKCVEPCEIREYFRSNGVEGHFIPASRQAPAAETHRAYSSEYSQNIIL